MTVRTSFNIDLIKQTIPLIQDELKLFQDTHPELLNDPNKDFKTELHIIDKFSSFSEEYPFIVKKVCTNEDITMIYTMLSRLDTVESGQNTLHEVETILGSELADKYISKINK